MITIYQIHLTDAEIFEINARGWDASPRTTAYSQMSFSGHNKWKAEYMPYFEATYEVDTDDLDEAFTETNLWNQPHMLTRIRRGRSSSVGDIFVKDGDCYIVDSFGFTNVGKYEGFK